MKIIFLGTGAGSTKGTKRFKSSIYINSGNNSVILDLGTGANMRIDDYNLYNFEAIMITHLHIDHFNGIFDHLVQRKLSNLPVIKVHSPVGFSKILESYIRAGNNVEAIIYEDNLPKLKLDDLYIYSIPSCHSIYAVSYIILDKNRKILYSGDTSEPCEEIIKEAKDADLIIHECSCLDNCRKWGHSSLRDLISLFSEKRVILTHIPSQIEKDIIEGARNKFLIAEDGLVINV
ncbi:MAG: MBL fold metallo-hydrolase [Sulfolobaceae archaeon]